MVFKINNLFSNPLVMVLCIMILLIIILVIFKVIYPSFTIGLDVNAHIGGLKGNFELEAFDDTYEYFENDDELEDDKDDDKDDDKGYYKEGDKEDDKEDDKGYYKQNSKNDMHNKPCLVMFYAEWCGHCKRAKPELEKAKNSYKGSVLIHMIDAEDPSNKDLVMSHDVKGFPTIRFYPNGLSGTNHEEYGNERAELMFLQYLMSKE
jgi:thiol-disulfide isomerase/thioredoxin